MYFAFIFLSVLVKSVRSDGSDCAVNGYEKYYSSPGDVYVIGLFDARKGENCSILNPAVLQQMYNVAVTITLLNNLNYLPGIAVGMALYDTCTSEDIARKTFISSLVDANCNVPYNLGILSSKSASEMINNISHVADIPVFTLDDESDPAVVLNISVKLLKELDYSRVDVALLPNPDFIRQFNRLALRHNICVGVSYTFSHVDDSCPGDNMLVFVAVTNAELSPLLKLSTDCLSTFVIAILDNNVDLPTITEQLPLHEAYVIIPTNIWAEFAVAAEGDFETVVATIQRNLRNSDVTADFIRTASGVVSIVEHFKSKLEAECEPRASSAEATGRRTLCANLSRFRESDEKALEALSLAIPRLLGVDVLVDEKGDVGAGPRRYSILKSHFNLADKLAEVRIAADGQIELRFAAVADSRANASRSGSKRPAEAEDEAEAVSCDWHSDECRRNCSNFDSAVEGRPRCNVAGLGLCAFFDGLPFALKADGWVPSVLTVCVIGVLCCGCVLCFVLARVLKGDILEGNPGTTLLLAAAAVLQYAAALPFAVQQPQPADRTLCALKLLGTSGGYSLLFSVVLSRLLMIVTCDYDGSFMSHVNGYLHSFLCLFMVAVQLALVLEFYLFGWLMPSEQRRQAHYCGQLADDAHLLLLLHLLYDAFLLVAIAAAAPFAAKSRRNYNEGPCLAVLAAALAAVWLCWCLGYSVASSASGRDFFVAFGLTGTASSVLVCVLIPRTYLIAAGLVRDRIAGALPSNISHLTDVNYRSTQALYDTVDLEAAKKGRLNAGYYDDPRAAAAASSSSSSCSSITRSEMPTPTSRRESADLVVRSVRLGPQTRYEHYSSSSAADQKITKF